MSARNLPDDVDAQHATFTGSDEAPECDVCDGDGCDACLPDPPDVGDVYDY